MLSPSGIYGPKKDRIWLIKVEAPVLFDQLASLLYNNNSKEHATIKYGSLRFKKEKSAYNII